MKFILEQAEIDKLKKDANQAGFERAEGVLAQVLEGFRDIKVTTNKGSVSIFDEAFKDNPWHKLIKRLDEGTYRGLKRERDAGQTEVAE